MKDIDLSGMSFLEVCNAYPEQVAKTIIELGNQKKFEKVFIVRKEIPYEYGEVCEVFSSKEKAKEYLNNSSDYKENKKCYSIDEWEVK